MKNKIFFCLLLVLFVFSLVGCSSATKIAFEEDVYYVKPGETITPVVRVYPKKFDYELTVSNDTVATVSDKSVTGLRDGTTAVLTATSGKLTASATLIVAQSTERNDVDVTLKSTYYVTFRLVNPDDVELETGLVSTDAYVEGDNVLRSLPAYPGFMVDGWYTDGACTQAFEPYAHPVKSDFTLYCRAIELENTFGVDGNDMITGILFPTLRHDDLVFPAELKGRTVKGIADNAFKDDTRLKTVTLPASYESIGDFAFAGCTSLTTVTLEEGSVLRSIGQFAFSVSSETTTNEDTGTVSVSSKENACAQLVAINLPDSVSHIGAFAFGFCTSLVLQGIPSGLTEITRGAFYKTKINAVDLTGVTVVDSFAFADCPDLSLVSHTENVVECAPGAFTGTALYLSQYKAGTDVFYVDTILIGCNSRFGRGMPGIGKHQASERITLVADKAFSEKNQANMTLYVDKPGVIFGEDVFVDSDGVCIAVPEDALARYKTDNPAYRDRFCVKTVVTIEDPTAVNFGRHVLLKFSDEEYYYDKFDLLTVNGRKTAPTSVDIAALPDVGRYVTRINTRAFNMYDEDTKREVAGMTSLSLGNPMGKTTYVTLLAVINCPSLTRIDLTGAMNLVEIEVNSFQFDSINKSCLVYVNGDDLGVYRTNWAGKGVAYERLTAD